MSKSYSVIHLSTSHTGGAGISARRLNNQLNKSGVNSSFFALSQASYLCKQNEFKLSRSFYQKTISIFSMLLAKYFSGINFFSIFSSSAISKRQLNNLLAGSNTILHIHNWFNLLSTKQLIKIIESRVPIVITLHDQRLMTGGCHNSLSCQNFKSKCSDCPVLPNFIDWLPSRNLQKILRVFNEPIKNLRLIAPSRYMLQEIKDSAVLKKQNVAFIPNVLPDTDFKTSNYSADRKTFTIGIASMDPSLILKGGDIIQDLLSLSEPLGDSLTFTNLKDFDNSSHSDFWGSIDCLVVPSRAENSPNVIHEAKLLGIPVIATNVGGISELITLGHDLLIELDDLSKESVLKAIFEIKNRKNNLKLKSISISDITNYSKNSLKDMEEIYRSFFD